jgi:hypothetical protein
VTPAFLTGAPFSNATTNNEGQLTRLEILTLQDQAGRNQLVNLTTADCLSTFGTSFETSFSAVVAVTDVISPASSLVQTGVPGSSLAEYVRSDQAGAMTLSDAPANIQFCLALPQDAATEAQQTCSVTLNGSLLGVVALLNLVSVIAAAAALTWRNFSPLATLGDALASFLDEPDHTTRGTCMLTKSDVWQQRWGFREAKYWVPTEHFWLQSPSLPRWLVWVFAWVLPTALAAAALALSVRDSPAGRLSGFGEVTPRGVFVFPDGTSRAGVALVAALPQLLVGVLYLQTNALLSTYFLSHELSLFAVPGQGRGLRVSSSVPEGAQTTGLYLTLPRPVSWVLLLLFAGMSFVLSQSVLVKSMDFPASLSADVPNPLPISGIGLSGTALLLLLGLLVLLAALVLGLGLRRADPSATLLNDQPAGNPLVLKGGSCSAVLSARCHRGSGEADVARREVRWGVLNRGEGMDLGHTTFSSRAVERLDVSRSYA